MQCPCGRRSKSLISRQEGAPSSGKQKGSLEENNATKTMLRPKSDDLHVFTLQIFCSWRESRLWGPKRKGMAACQLPV